MLSFAIVGCGAESRPVDPEDPFIDHAELGPILLRGAPFSDSPALGQPNQLRLVSEWLWVSDAATDPGLHILDAESGTIIQSIGTRGEGPGEFARRPFALEVDPTDPEALWAFDQRLQRITRFEPRPLDEYDFVTVRLESPVRIQRIAWVGEDRIIGQAHSMDTRFVIFSTDGTTRAKTAAPVLGPVEASDTERLKATTDNTRMCTWPGRGFVIANAVVGRIAAYDTAANFVREFDVPFPSEPVFEPDAQGRLTFRAPRRWYLACYAAGEHLFALFSGRLVSGLEGTGRSSGRFLHVFDWNGTLQHVFEFDRDISGVAVNADETTLYAGSLEDSQLYRYQLPRLR